MIASRPTRERTQAALGKPPAFRRPIAVVAAVALVLFQGVPVMSWDSSKFKKPEKAELKKKLTDLQYEVTQEEGTERPFRNEHWDRKEEGLYVDVVSGEPLFSSKDKYDSGTGWPSFTKPLTADSVTTKKDRRLFVTRTEVRSRHADSHLGHVFEDGPEPTGLRYCMNSAAMRFIPAKDLEKEGYGEWARLFQTEGGKTPGENKPGQR